MAQQTQLGRRATNIRHEDGFTVVRYHYTDVFKLSDDHKTVILNTGGWQTPTTKTRMNQAASQFGVPITVFQKDFGWFIKTPKGTIDFEDGIEVKL